MPHSDIFRERRIVLKFDGLGLPEFEVLGRANYTKAHAPLKDHHHPASFEICYLAKGRQTYWIGDRSYDLSGGDLFVTIPDEVHSTGGGPEEKSLLYWVRLHAPAGRPLFNLGEKESAKLVAALSHLSDRRFKARADLRTILDDIIRAYFDEKIPLKKLVIQTRFVEFLLEVVLSGRAAAARKPSASLVGMLRYVEANLEEPLTIGALAKWSGLSAVSIKTKFKKELGVPPMEFILRKKIDRAKRLLRDAKLNVTQIAFDLGFSSSQYFATVFKRFTGRRPGAWNRNHGPSDWAPMPKSVPFLIG